MNNMRALLTINALSSLSLWIDFFLIFLVPIYLWNSQPYEIATLAFSLGSASLFLGPIAGVMLDRIHIKTSLLTGISLRFATTLGFFLAPSFEWFLIIAILKGLSNMLYFPTISISIKQLIPADSRTDFFSYSSLLDQITKIATPLLAGILTLWLPTQSIFLISAALLLTTISFLKCIWSRLEPAPSNNKLTIKGVLIDLSDGAKIFRSLDFQLKIGFFYSLLTSLALACYDPHLASLLTSLQFPAVVFSLVVSSTAAGAVFAAIGVKTKFIKLNEIKLRTLGLALFSVAILAACITLYFAPIIHPAYLMFFWFVNGFGYELLMISSNVILQNLCPAAKLGRVSASFRSLQMLCIVLGPTLGSLLISAFSRASPFILASALMLFATTIAIYFQYFAKRLDNTESQTT
ncbi:MFS transporter [Pseudomonas sp. MSSRFD41]|uniref:MFS transporter n=1 Tax=Pseudomonas sp. MSSRFD41 TaxID=1310370 RepID=UPI00163A1BD4|nr:MFS transporter [Pseudomonas sp. MSSRFD41]MBC2658118.1 MFS transporter [Pseudomonas sp. MSSRFD41]